MYVSPFWKPYGPFVQFSSNKTTDRGRLGRCTVDDLDDEDSRRDFQVHFYSDLGPKEGEENLLAQYSVSGKNFAFLKILLFLKLFNIFFIKP